MQTKLGGDLGGRQATLFQPDDGISVLGFRGGIVSASFRPVHGMAFLVGYAFASVYQIHVPFLQVCVKSLSRHPGLPGNMCGGYGSGAVQAHHLGILLFLCRRGRMDGATSGYLSFSLSPDGFFSYLDAPLHQILVVKQQVLFQPGV